MNWFLRLLPNLVPVSFRERLRAATGAFCGLLITATIMALVVGTGPELPLLMAPIGASAVLLFAVPASPLAQPWSIMGGNCLAALVGVTCAMLIDDVALAAALAVSVSIALMLSLRCLHPPSGAVALTAVIGGPAISALGYGFVLWPVAINSLLLLVIAIVFNRLTGKQYPHLAPASMPAIARDNVVPYTPQLSLGVTPADLELAIRERDEVISVDAADLEEVLHRAEALAFARRSGGITAGLIMSVKVATVRPETGLRVALRLLRDRGIKALPVVDEGRRLVGIITQRDLLDKADWGPPKASSGLGWRLRSITNSGRPLRGKVRDVMTLRVVSVPPTMAIAMVVQLMLDGGHHHLPVVGSDGVLVGMVTQSDVVAALFSANAGELRQIA